LSLPEAGVTTTSYELLPLVYVNVAAARAASHPQADLAQESGQLRRVEDLPGERLQRSSALELRRLVLCQAQHARLAVAESREKLVELCHVSRVAARVR
jgi:hypothetical protein